MKIRDAKQSFLEAKQDCSPLTISQYSKALDYLEQECPDMPDKPEPLRQALNRVPNIWVRDSYWRIWKAFFRWCLIEYGIVNVMERVARPNIPDIEITALEPDQLTMVLSAADNLMDKLVCALALDSGVRASEFGPIRASDIGNETIRLWGKGQKQIRVPISPETYHLFELLLQEDGRNPQGLLFCDRNGKPLSRFAIYRIVRKCMDKAGIRGTKRGPHCLRHSLGMNFIANGGNPFSLKRIMRHKSIATTDKYVNLALRTVVDQHHQHSPLRDAIRGAQGVLISRELDQILEKKQAERR